MSEQKKTANDRVLKICLTAMFAALICVATVVVQIPAPSGGFLNFGDCFVIISGLILGPVYGFAAGGIGSAMADLIAYPVYAPATFIIKGLMAVAASLIAKAFLKKNVRLQFVGSVVGGLAAELIMSFGYMLFEILFMGFDYAAVIVNLPFNLIQGGFGLILAVALIQVIAKTGVLRKINPYAVANCNK